MCVWVESKMLREKVAIPGDVIASDPDPFDNIDNNSSMKLAELVTTKDRYRLQNFFPRLSRSLKRRLSEELGATAAGAGPGLANIGPPPSTPPAATSGGAASTAPSPTQLQTPEPLEPEEENMELQEVAPGPEVEDSQVP